MQHSVISMKQNTATTITTTQEQAPFLHKHKRRMLPLEYANFECKRGQDLSEVTRGYYFSYHMMHSRPHLCKDLLQISEMHFTWLTTSKVLTAPSFLTGNKGLSDWKQRPSYQLYWSLRLGGWLHCHAWPCFPVLETYTGHVWFERHLLAAHAQRAESAFRPISVCLSGLFPSVIGLDCWTGQT